MKKINVLKDGTAKVQDVKMTAKQKQDYIQKVEDSLFEMIEKWQYQSCNNFTHPTYLGMLKAVEHTENVLQTEKADIPMKFAFTKPEQCAIYLAFVFGAFDCLHMAELTTATEAAAAMIKVLTSGKARNEILSNC